MEPAGTYSSIGGAPDGLRFLEEGRTNESAASYRSPVLRILTAAFAALATVALIKFVPTEHFSAVQTFSLWSSKMWTPDICTPMVVSIPRVEDMTLDEKIGQMTQVDQLAVTTSRGHGDDIAKYFIGSVLSGGGGAPAWGNTGADWAALIDHLQSKVSRTRLQIPIVYGIDAVHGNSNLYGATIFPHHVGLGATRNPELVRRMGAAAARETAGTGMRWAFSPAVSVCQDPRWGRCYESFSEKTEVVSLVATAEVEGWQARATDASDSAYVVPGDILVAATAKHFIGDGGTQGGKDQGDTLISEEELRRVHLPPYIEAIKKGVQTIMISYSSWNSLKMHGNHYLVTDVLKGELGFDGVVVSDWAAIQQLPGNWSDQVRNSVNAGLDMIMVPTTYKEFIATLKEEVLAGRVAMSRIDDSVRRILKMKVTLGLFENACAQKSLLKTMGSPEHRAIAREAACQSLVLLQNEKRGLAGKSMFPLPLQGAKILVAGTHANDIGLQCGGWTIQWQGLAGNTTVGTTILEGIMQAAEGKASVEYRMQPEGNEKADYGIVVVGEIPYAEFHGDDQALQLDASSQAAISAVCKNMPCVVVLISGRALQVNYLLPKVDALIAAWLPGTEGNGVADALFGNEDFKGRLPISWFPDTISLPGGNAPSTTLFPYGFGLSKMGNQLPKLD